MAPLAEDRQIRRIFVTQSFVRSVMNVQMIGAVAYLASPTSAFESAKALSGPCGGSEIFLIIDQGCVSGTLGLSSQVPLTWLGAYRLRTTTAEVAYHHRLRRSLSFSGRAADQAGSWPSARAG